MLLLVFFKQDSYVADYLQDKTSKQLIFLSPHKTAEKLSGLYSKWVAELSFNKLFAEYIVSISLA